MTTILKAVQEQERRDHRLRGQTAAARNEQQSRLRWITVGAVLTLSVAAIGGAVLLRGRNAPPTAPAPSTSSAPQPQVAPPETIHQHAASQQALPAAPLAAPIAPSASDKQPQGKGDAGRPAAPPRAASLLPPKRRAAPRQAALPREPSTPATAAQGSPGSGLRVESVSYSQVGGQSSVTLETAGRMVILHEGESADGVEVQLIEPSMVYLRRDGSVFAVNVAR